MEEEEEEKEGHCGIVSSLLPSRTTWPLGNHFSSSRQRGREEGRAPLLGRRTCTIKQSAGGEGKPRPTDLTRAISATE